MSDGSFSASGIDALIADMRSAGNIPAGTLKAMVDAKAEVMEKAMVYTAGTMLQGPYFEGEVARSVKRKKPRVTKGGATEVITFEGTQHGNRLGEIAFINEYGKKSQPARPFIKSAAKDSEGPGTEAARNILHEHLENNNL